MAGLGLIGSGIAGGMIGAGDFAQGYLTRSQLQDEAASIEEKRGQTLALLAQQTHAANAEVDTGQAVNRQNLMIPGKVAEQGALAPGVTAAEEAKAKIARETARVAPHAVDGTLIQPNADATQPPTVTEAIPGKGKAGIEKTNAEASYAGAHGKYLETLPGREDRRDQRAIDTAERNRIHDVLVGATNEVKNAQQEEQKIRENFRKEHELSPPTDTEKAQHTAELGQVRKRMQKAQQTIDDANKRLLRDNGGAAPGGERPPLDAFAGKTAVPATPERTPEQPPAKPRGIIQSMAPDNPFSNVSDALPPGATRNAEGSIVFPPKAQPRALPPMFR